MPMHWITNLLLILFQTRDEILLFPLRSSLSHVVQSRQRFHSKYNVQNTNATRWPSGEQRNPSNQFLFECTTWNLKNNKALYWISYYLARWHLFKFKKWHWVILTFDLKFSYYKIPVVFNERVLADVEKFRAL